MLSPARMIFPHRHNEDGSHDSICTLCLATVASTSNEDDLAQFETTHSCKLTRLSKVSQKIVHDHVTAKLPPRSVAGPFRKWWYR